MKKWKYMRMTTDGTTVKRFDGYEAAGPLKEFVALERLGEQGWELVTVVPHENNFVFFFRQSE